VGYRLTASASGGKYHRGRMIGCQVREAELDMTPSVRGALARSTVLQIGRHASRFPPENIRGTNIRLSGTALNPVDDIAVAG
jgi:hypothetical protein